ncbi:hypothetical protein, partial [Campylobacter concisus]|uniref:hypothetical protein n=1 Tax=Campylobacter concisus TaxID=199 RepID=UPI00122CF80D
MRENIYSVKDSTPNLDMLPKSELKENIYKDFNQFEANYQAKKIREAKAKIAFSEKLNIEDIILIKQYEDDKFILLLDSAINIKNELLELTESEKISFGIKTFFEFLLCGLLILSLLGISARLKFLKVLIDKSKYISNYILSSKETSADNAISKLIKTYEDLKETYIKDSSFFQIKDRY